MMGNENNAWHLRPWLIISLSVCVVMYVLTYGLDLDSPVKWEMRFAISLLLSGIVVLSLYVLLRVIQISAWRGVVAFAFTVLFLFLAIKLAINCTESSVPDLGTAHLYLRMPIAVAAGLIGGAGSLLLARAFWAKGRSVVNIIAAGYFVVTGVALMVSYFLIDLLAGFMRLFSVSV